jgi:hypothetical protein
MIKKQQYIFCFNQVSFIIASEMVKSNYQQSQIIIIPKRVHKNNDDDLDIIAYNPISTLFIFIRSLFFKNIEVVIPHPKGGRISRWMAKYSRKLSYIDDGMDTFRDVPKNVELNLIRKNTNYYSFDYDLPIAKWLDGLNVVPVCSVRSLANDVKPPANIEEFDGLVIESPGINMNADYVNNRNFLLFRHPSYKKNQNLRAVGRSVSGLEYSLEKTLLNCEGEVVVGETMALIFALCCMTKEICIHLHLTASQHENLSCLHLVLLSRVKLSVDGINDIDVKI